MPGLADMHVHLLPAFAAPKVEAQYQEDRQDNYSMFELFVANGVTTVLNMWGHPVHLKLRDKVLQGEVFGPLIYTTGPYINERAKTSEEVERAVIEDKRAGYDFVKLHGDLSKEAYATLFAVARREGIRVVGHAPRKLGMEVLLEEHQAAIAHAEEYIYSYFGFRQRLPEFFLSAPGNNGDELEVKIRQISEATAKSGTWVIPTLTVYKGIAAQIGNIEAVLQRPEVKYLPRRLLVKWLPENNTYVKRFTKDPTSLVFFQTTYELLRRLVKGLRNAGVHLLAGTDTTVPCVVPGFSMHDELSELVDAGLTPYEAIKTATAGAAEFLGVLNKMGTISVGKRADLILVDANPLEDITNVQKRSGVMLRGQWLSEAELRKMLAKLAALYGNG